jgi:peptide/nickel transport system substrate-binding protein
MNERKRDLEAIGRTVVAIIIVIIIIIAGVGAYAALVGKTSTTSTTPPTSTSMSSVSSTSLSSAVSSTPSSSATSSGNKTLTAGFLEDVTSLNPVNWFTISDLDVLQLIFNTLVEVNSSGLPAPGLASSWTVSPNGTVYTFNLVSNAMWQDGQPVTANDVAFTFNYWKQYKFPYYAALGGGINSTTVVNNSTVEVVLSHPNAGFLLDLADLGMIIPQHIWSSVTSPDNYTGSNELIGDGPFSFVSRSTGVNIILKANPTYFGGAPHYQNLVINVYSSVDSAIASIESGALNLFELPEGTNLAPLNSSSSIHIVTTPSTMIYYISMNTQTYPFNNSLVRQAVAYAVNKSAVVSLAFDSQADVANSVLSPALSYFYNPGVNNYTSNNAMAENLLTQAGYSNSSGVWKSSNGTDLSFTLLIINQAPWVEMAQIIQQDLGAIGIPAANVVISQVDPSTQESDVISTHNYQMTLDAWRLYFDPMLFIEPSFHSTEDGPNGLDFSVFQNSTVDSLIVSALNQSSLANEKPIINQIQVDVAQQVPWIMLAYGQDIWSVQGFSGWQPVPRYGLWYYSTFLNLTPNS